MVKRSFALGLVFLFLSNFTVAAHAPDSVEVELLGHKAIKSERLIVDRYTATAIAQLSVFVDNRSKDSEIQYAVIDAYKGKIIDKGTVKSNDNIFTTLEVTRGEYYIELSLADHNNNSVLGPIEGTASLGLIH